MTRLILWDVDRTLLVGGGVAVELADAGAHQVLGDLSDVEHAVSLLAGRSR